MRLRISKATQNIEFFLNALELFPLWIFASLDLGDNEILQVILDDLYNMHVFSAWSFVLSIFLSRLLFIIPRVPMPGENHFISIQDDIMSLKLS